MISIRKPLCDKIQFKILFFKLGVDVVKFLYGRKSGIDQNKKA